MRLTRRAAVLGAPLALMGCGAKSVWAPDEAIQRVAYRDPGPARLTLLTMINNRTGQGAHSSIMINASQRVIFDPAGSVVHASIPERNDVLFGISPSVADFYIRAHARETFHVVIQDLDVSPEIAEGALQLALNYGPVPQAYCTQATSGILQQLPGFEFIRSTWYPRQLSDQFQTIPGVKARRLYENDDDDKSVAIRAYDEELRLSQSQ